MTKARVLTEKKNKKQRDNTKTQAKTAITQRLRSDIGWSVRVTIATQLVLLNRFTGSNPYHLPQQSCNQKDTHLLIILRIETEDQQPSEAERS